MILFIEKKLHCRGYDFILDLSCITFMMAAVFLNVYFFYSYDSTHYAQHHNTSEREDKIILI